VTNVNTKFQIDDTINKHSEHSKLRLQHEW